MKWILNIGLALVVLSAAGGVATWFYRTRPVPTRIERAEIGVLVETMRAEPKAHRVRVVGMGTVIAARQVVVRPEVSGRLVELHPALVPGGLLPKGTVLTRIDPRDYETLVEARKADLERSEFELKVEAGRQTVAHREWELLEGGLKGTQMDLDLALRKPHLQVAEAVKKAAQSSLDKARLDLERTAIKVPFNAVVQDESAEIGQLVNPQASLATLVGTDTFWVRVSVPIDRLAWIRMPRGDGGEGAEARIVQETTSGVSVVRQGRVERVLGDLDPVGRMARLVVAIDDPLGLRDASGETGLPLLLGAYVRVEIEGREQPDAFSVPRVAVRDGDRVWIMNGEDRLQIRDVDIAWRGPTTVLIRDGLEAGERVVTSQIGIPMTGMKLRLQDEATAAPDGEPAGGRAPAPEGDDA